MHLLFGCLTFLIPESPSFIVFVNDLDVYVKGKMFKFADEANIVVRVGSKEGIDTLEENLID